MNVVDEQTMRSSLEADGFSSVGDWEGAEIVVVTTCAVRESAEERVWGRLGDLKRWKAGRPGRRVVVAGCMAEKNGEAIVRRAPHVDLVLGTAHFAEIAGRLDDRIRRNGTRVVVGVPRGRLPDGFHSASVPLAAPRGAVEEPAFASWTARDANPLHAFVKVMEGCDHFCTYCIVPLTRGKERSRAPEAIEAEARRLVDRGVREITLLGQNVNSYGRGLEPRVRFSDLLARLDRIDGLLRLRFTTSHPQDCGDDLLDALRDLRSVCEHLHLPFQSGSDRVLSRMNRKYTGASFLELVERARRCVPGIAVTTDVIVGFPGEDEDDYLDTVRLMDAARFEGAFLFLFSPREGTPAASMEGQVPADVAARRFEAILRMQNRLAGRASAESVGRTELVLVEGPSKRDPSVLSGRTRAFRTAIFEAPIEAIGRELPVRITRAAAWTLFGEVAAA